MKKLISIIVCLALFFSCSISSTSALDNEFTKSAQEIVSEISVGWNLGNTLEATIPWNWTLDRNPTPYEEETGWNNAYTTKEMINFVADSGYNAVRIPVSWYIQTTESNGVYTINDEWITRVETVVGYCLDNNMYTIIDMHHDDKDWLDLSASDDDWNGIIEEYRQLWQQIATRFKDYGEKLVFESNNEVVNGDDWWGHDEQFNRLNNMYQVFVDTVRGSGGNNDKRYIMLPTFGAQKYVHQLEKLVIPNNDRHCIIDVHYYTDNSSDTATMKTNFNVLKTWAEKFNLPIVIGECGIKKSYDDYTKKEWAQNYIGLAIAYGLKCFLWDDGGNYRMLERKVTPLCWRSPAFMRQILTYAGCLTIYGDVNCDEKVNVIDVNYLCRYLVHFGTIYNSPVENNSDVNKDGVIDMKDLLIIKKYIAQRAIL